MLSLPPASAAAEGAGHVVVGAWSSGGMEMVFEAGGKGRFVDIAFTWKALDATTVLVRGPIAMDTLQTRFTVRLDENSRPVGRFDAPLLNMLLFVRIKPEGIMVRGPGSTAPAATRLGRFDIVRSRSAARVARAWPAPCEALRGLGPCNFPEIAWSQNRGAQAFAFPAGFR
jgi:hypothetical protein